MDHYPEALGWGSGREKELVAVLVGLLVVVVVVVVVVAGGCWSLDILTTRGEQSPSSSFGVTHTAWWPEWELPRMFFGPRVGFCVVLISY